MNDHKSSNERENRDIDPGRPIPDLKYIEEAVSPKFVDSTIRKIERRVLSIDFLEFTKNSFWEMFMSYWTMIITMVKGTNQDEGGRKGE
jgi:hypothetical protein